jgi:hypothetical protein
MSALRDAILAQPFEFYHGRIPFPVDLLLKRLHELKAGGSTDLFDPEVDRGLIDSLLDRICSPDPRDLSRDIVSAICMRAGIAASAYYQIFCARSNLSIGHSFSGSLGPCYLDHCC